MGSTAGTGDADERAYQIRALQPPISNEESARDWRKVVDKLRKQQFGEARHKLAEWEAQHGTCYETTDLAKQLDALPEKLLRPRIRTTVDD